MSNIHRQLEQLLAGAELKGGVAEVQNGHLEVRQIHGTVGVLKPIPESNNWLLGLEVQHGTTEEGLLITCELTASDQWPAVHGTVDVEGIGKCTFCATIRGNSIAGVWNCGPRSGQLFATICAPPSALRRQYTIERASECMHDWWTGNGWSDDFRNARWYTMEPDAGAETDDEGAYAVHYASGRYEGD
ncbi:hypothetical protein GC176_21965 [bacterium]|nr:hypothetical protein [bacterium]